MVTHEAQLKDLRKINGIHKPWFYVLYLFSLLDKSCFEKASLLLESFIFVSAWVFNENTVEDVRGVRSF